MRDDMSKRSWNGAQKALVDVLGAPVECEGCKTVRDLREAYARAVNSKEYDNGERRRAEADLDQAHAELEAEQAAHEETRRELAELQEAHVGLISRHDEMKQALADATANVDQLWERLQCMKQDAGQHHRDLAEQLRRADDRLESVVAVAIESVTAGVARGLGEGISRLATPSE